MRTKGNTVPGDIPSVISSNGGYNVESLKENNSDCPLVRIVMSEDNLLLAFGIGCLDQD